MNKKITDVFITLIMCIGVMIQNCCAPIRRTAPASRVITHADKWTQLSNRMMTLLQTTPIKIPHNNGKRLDLFNRISRESQLGLSKVHKSSVRMVLLKLYAQLYDAMIQSISHLYPGDMIVQRNFQFLDDLAIFIDDIEPPCFTNHYPKKLKAGERARLLYETALEVI